MQAYSTDSFERIAAAVSKDVDDVVRHQRLFERAAHYYDLDCGLPRPTGPRLRRIPPSKMRIKLQQIAGSARRLLKHLDVPKTGDAYDGPGNAQLLETLSWAEKYNENAVVTATRRIGRLAEILEAIEATSAIEEYADKSADEAGVFGKLTGKPGHQGDVAVNNWIAMMMEAYREITGSEPVTSVGGDNQPNEGIASGPFVRFLAAAGEPLKIGYSKDAWRSRVRTVQCPKN